MRSWQAGMLHDTLEDTSVTLTEVRAEMGAGVAAIVEAVSEPDKSLAWEDRKRHTLERLKTAPLDVRLVACADKLHNLRTTAAAHAEEGEAVWERFRRGRGAQAWYYRGLVASLCDGRDNRGYGALFEDFEREVEAFFGKPGKGR